MSELKSETIKNSPFNLTPNAVLAFVSRNDSKRMTDSPPQYCVEPVQGRSANGDSSRSGARLDRRQRERRWALDDVVEQSVMNQNGPPQVHTSMPTGPQSSLANDARPSIPNAHVFSKVGSRKTSRVAPASESERFPRGPTLKNVGALPALRLPLWPPWIEQLRDAGHSQARFQYPATCRLGWDPLDECPRRLR